MKDKAVIVPVRMPAADAERLDALVARTPMARSTVLRQLALIGLDVIKNDIGRLVRPAKEAGR